MPTSPPLLVDSMIVIEAVRTGCWNAISGQRDVVTVPECTAELLRGDPGTKGYVPVTEQELARVTVAPVSRLEAAAFRLGYPDADGMDAGERELLAHARARTDDFQLCSCDKAAVRAAHALGWSDRLVSLETVAAAVGVRPSPSLKPQYSEGRLSQWRMSLALGGPI